MTDAEPSLSAASQQQFMGAVLTMEHGSTTKTFLPRSIRKVASSALMLSADGRGLPWPANGTHWGAGEEPAAKDVEDDATLSQGMKTRVGCDDGLTEDAVMPPTCSALAPSTQMAETVPTSNSLMHPL